MLPQHELTIIILDGDVCLIKAWSHYYSWLATRISKEDLELFISLHNELICHWNVQLDAGLPSRDGNFSRESSSEEINTSSWGEWEAVDEICKVANYQLAGLNTFHLNSITFHYLVLWKGLEYLQGESSYGDLSTSTHANNDTCDSFTSHHC